jgi:hypothetical protein
MDKTTSTAANIEQDLASATKAAVNNDSDKAIRGVHEPTASDQDALAAVTQDLFRSYGGFC